MRNYQFKDKIEKADTPAFNIKYCLRCCMPETEEGYNENEYGMCRICQSSEQKMHIDWVKRRHMLEKIVDKCKAQANNNYDCMVPISGGKDSSFQLYVLTKVFNMKPLAVTYSHNWFSKTGWYNLMRALKEFNVDHIIYTPNRSLVNRLAKRSLEMIGDACWSCHAGVGAFPLYIATKYNIPVIFYGESAAEATQRGDYSEQKFEYDKSYYTQFSAKKTPDEMLCDSLISKDLFMYQLPTDKEYQDAKIKMLHLGDFIFWDDERQMEFIRDTYGWKETDIENSYKGYQSAECIMPGVHDFTCYLKRGWGKASVQASTDVRNGVLTRDEGFKLANSVDAQKPEVLDYYLKATGMGEGEFYETIGKHMATSLKNQVIPILPKAVKNKERLVPFAEQLVEEYKGSEKQPDLRLNELCATCGLELGKGSSTCQNCAKLSLAGEHRADRVKQLDDCIKEITQASGDNFDCLMRLDDSWQSVYMLHLVKNIYKLKPLVVTFDQFSFTKTGWFNVVNCLETFKVDQLMFTPGVDLTVKLREQSKTLFSDENHLHELGLYAFMIKTACEFNVPTIVDCNDSLMKIAGRHTFEGSIHYQVDLGALQDTADKVANSSLKLRDIYLFSTECLKGENIKDLRLILFQELFEFNDSALAFAEKYYGWKEDRSADQRSFAEQFLAENKPAITPGYMLAKESLGKPRTAHVTQDLSAISAKRMVRGFINKEFSPVEVAKAVIEKTEKVDSSVNVWEFFEPEKFLELAKMCEKDILKNGVTRVMDGVPVGVKDIFNTIDFPTQMGSPLWKGFTPGNDARAVHNLKRAGALICGKTVTSEFAVHALNKTINPHGPDRTPGTSSSGSAVAIAMGMIPVSLGTQSGASIIRPASFCGVYGFKPSFGLIPRTGILKTTDTLDNVGFFVRHAEDLENVFNTIRLHGRNYPMNSAGMNKSRERMSDTGRKWKIAFAKTHTWSAAERYAQEALTGWMSRLSTMADIEIEEVELPQGMENCHDLHAVIYNHCLAYYFSEEFKSKDGMTERLKGQIEHGKHVGPKEYQAALKEQVSLWQKMDHFLDDYDVMISLSTAGEAPILGEIEKPDPGLMWTLTNLPSLGVPAFRSPGGMPFGLQIAARRYSDLLILHLVNRLIENEMAPTLSNPVLDFK